MYFIIKGKFIYANIKQMDKVHFLSVCLWITWERQVNITFMKKRIYIIVKQTSTSEINWSWMFDE